VTKKHKTPHHHHDGPVPAQEPIQAPEQPELPGTAAAVPVEPPEEAVKRLSAEVESHQDQYLRLAADFENFRKRMQKERAETWSKAQAEVVARVLDALDDLGRVAHLDPERTSAKDLAAGVELVERKLVKQLEAAGLVRVGQAGEKFDPASHEAVSTVPAPSPEQDHTVAAVFQPGYRFGTALLRPARVQVHVWQDAAAPAASES